MKKQRLTFLATSLVTQQALSRQPHILRVDEEAQAVNPTDGKAFREQQLAELLECRCGGLVRLGTTGLALVFDDESKLTGKPYNHLATAFWLTIEPHVKGYDYVAGTAIICRENLVKSLP